MSVGALTNGQASSDTTRHEEGGLLHGQLENGGGGEIRRDVSLVP